MYRLVKDAGRYENVFLVNTDTMATLNLGPLTNRLMVILRDLDYILEEDLNMTSSFDLEINDATKDALVKFAMPMKKPIRSKSKKPTKEKVYANALDIIFN